MLRKNDFVCVYVASSKQKQKQNLFTYSLSSCDDSCNESVKQLWSAERGRPLLRATMSRHRFQLFLERIRFDDEETRSELKQNNKRAAMRTYDMLTAHSSVTGLHVRHTTLSHVPKKNRSLG